MSNAWMVLQVVPKILVFTTIKVVSSITSSSNPGLTYYCMVGDKVRKVSTELHFSTVEYLILLDKWAVLLNTIIHNEGD